MAQSQLKTQYDFRVKNNKKTLAESSGAKKCLDEFIQALEDNQLHNPDYHKEKISRAVLTGNLLTVEFRRDSKSDIVNVPTGTDMININEVYVDSTNIVNVSMRLRGDKSDR